MPAALAASIMPGQEETLAERWNPDAIWLGKVRLADGHAISRTLGEQMGPVQIKAQLLRGRPTAPAGAVGDFPVASDEPVGGAGAAEPRGKTAWRQSDIRRAIAAAEQAGLESYRVEIATDGTLSIIVGAPAETASDPDPFGNLFGS